MHVLMPQVLNISGNYVRKLEPPASIQIHSRILNLPEPTIFIHIFIILLKVKEILLLLHEAIDKILKIRSLRTRLHRIQPLAITDRM